MIFRPPRSILSDEGFTVVQKLLLGKMGLYFTRNRKFQTESGIRERMEETGISSVKDYLHELKFGSAHKDEIRALAEKLTVQETSFFRFGQQFEVMREVIVPEIIRKREKRRFIRIWSAGCSTGQEPYTIAMVLLDSLPEPASWEISILATDINRPALDTAARGIYGQNAVSSVPFRYLNTYFQRKENDYYISDKVRKTIFFRDHNLVTEDYSLPAMQSLDIIFCRNVTIYFDLATIKKVIDHFYRKIVVGGHHFLGHSETLWKISDKFEAVEYRNTFFYRKPVTLLAASKRPHIPIPELSVGFRRTVRKNKKVAPAPCPPLKPKAGPSPLKEDYGNIFDQAAEASRLKRYDDALALLKRLGPNDPPYDRAQLAQAGILANQGKAEEAITILSGVIGRDNLCELAYYLLGLLYNRSDQDEKAIEMLKKALYVNPENALVSFHLAELYHQTENLPLARKSYENTLKSLEALPQDYEFPLSAEITPLMISQACIKELEMIEKS